MVVHAQCEVDRSGRDLRQVFGPGPRTPGQDQKPLGRVMDIVAHYHGVNAGSQLRHDIDKWVRHCVQLCDRPEEYEHGGISPRGRLLSACSTTDEELEQFLPTPEVCNKEIRRARVVQPEQVWLTAVLRTISTSTPTSGFSRVRNWRVSLLVLCGVP